MPNRANIELDQGDLRRVIKKMRDLGATKAEVLNAIDKEAHNAEVRMKRAAPRDTGRLVRNIEVTRSRNFVQFDSEAIDPQSGIDYAPIQELPNGTMPFKTTPYFWRNIRQFQRKIFPRINDILTRIINRRN